MATYPSLPIDPDGSQRKRRDGREEDVVGDGVTRVRKLHADRFDFVLKHSDLSASQLAALDAFYAANSTAASFDLVWPTNNVTYQVKFGKDAIEEKPNAGINHDYIVRLVSA